SFTPTFTWTIGQYVDNHRIEVDNDDNWFNGVVDNVVLGATDNTWTKPSPGYSTGTYYWRVIAINQWGENVSDNTWQFTVVGAPPTKPQLYKPDNNAYVRRNPTFEWVVANNADNHRIEVDNDDNWFNGVVDNVVLGATDNTWSKTWPSFYQYRTYYWRVVAVNPLGENYSEVRLFTVIADWDITESWTFTINSIALS
ncbi:MAG: hypothetical protein ACK4GQ_06545, partial [Candidatus Hadarchaeales archaeon]